MSRSCGGRRRSGFTLIELLVVVAIIGILATLVTGAAQHAMGLARARRVEISKQILQTALLRYRTDYNKWPDDLEHGSANGDKTVYTYSGENNKWVLSPLRHGDDGNQSNIRYIDETTFLAPGGKKTFVKLSDADNGVPFVYKSRKGNCFFFVVKINAEDDTASVGNDPNDKDNDD